MPTTDQLPTNYRPKVESIPRLLAEVHDDCGKLRLVNIVFRRKPCDPTNVRVKNAVVQLYGWKEINSHAGVVTCCLKFDSTRTTSRFIPSVLLVVPFKRDKPKPARHLYHVAEVWSTETFCNPIARFLLYFIQATVVGRYNGLLSPTQKSSPSCLRAAIPAPPLTPKCSHYPGAF